MFAHALHLQPVGDNHARVAVFVFQQFGYDGVGVRRDRIAAAVEGGDVEVSYHDQIYTFVDELAVGVELQFVQFGATFLDDRQAEMRVGFRVAMSREVFDTADDTAVRHALQVEVGLADDLVAILTEGAAVDDGVFGVVVDVDAGGEVEVDAKGFALGGHFEAHQVDERVVFCRQGTQCHLAWECRTTVDAHVRSPLTVDGDEEWHFAERLHLVGEGGLAHGPALEEAHATRLVARDVVQHGLVLRRRARGAHAHNHQLCNLFLQRHLGEHLLGPRLRQNRCR